MLWRVRAGLPDRPGALAELAAACGRAGVNIQTLQIFPDAGRVTDELVLQVPEEWTPEQLRALVGDAGGEAVAVVPVTTAALEDQPTRYVQAVRAVIAQPATFPEVAAHLFDADVTPRAGADVLEMTVGAATTIQIRRDIPFTAVERARASALADLVGEVLAAHGPPQAAPTPPQSASGAPEFVTEGAVVSALAKGAVIGRAEVTAEGSPERPWPVDLWVDPAWHRRGVGTRLLADIARVARSHGGTEIVLTAPSDTKAVLPMVLAAGMRGRIRMAGDTLTVRIAITDVRA